MKTTNPNELLRYHVTGAIERGEAEAIAGKPVMLHFQTGNYLHIKSESGNYGLRIESGYTLDQAVVAAILECEREIDRIKRRLKHYEAFHRGETVSNPDALR